MRTQFLEFDASRSFAFYAKTLLVCLLTLLPACHRPGQGRVQGYVEGEYIYVSAPLSGKLLLLSVSRGQQVAAGDPLFALDETPQRAARDETAGRLDQAKARLEDLRKGKRPTEITSLEAQLKEAQAANQLAERDLARRQQLMSSGVVAKEEFDRARSARDQTLQRVSQLESDLETAKLGARSDQVAAAEAEVAALAANLERATWELNQMRQSATQAGLIFDTFYREGEWVSAGRPVVALLPPRGIKVRAFIPEDWVGAIHAGDSVQVHADGISQSLTGAVSFISPQAEYTPPVLYSRDNRNKLVFMVECVFDPSLSAELHPGQPVDVVFGP